MVLVDVEKRCRRALLEPRMVCDAHRTDGERKLLIGADRYDDLGSRARYLVCDNRHLADQFRALGKARLQGGRAGYRE